MVLEPKVIRLKFRNLLLKLLMDQVGSLAIFTSFTQDAYVFRKVCIFVVTCSFFFFSWQLKQNNHQFFTFFVCLFVLLDRNSHTVL